MNPPQETPKPKWLCIGAQKAGTSWLHEQLRKHPNVWTPPIKELHYFDHVYVELVRKWTAGHVKKATVSALNHHLKTSKNPDWGYIKYLAHMADTDLFSEKWFLRCFDRPQARGKACGDITPEYSSLPSEGIDYMLKLLPGVRIIYIIRDPVERAVSQLRMNIERRGSDASEDKMLDMCEEEDVNHRGNYSAYVPRWKSKVPVGNLLFLPYGMIRSEPAAFLRKIEEFIGIPAFQGYDLQRVVHQTKKIELPDSVVQRLTDKFDYQRRYLQKEFGDEFFARTK